MKRRILIGIIVGLIALFSCSKNNDPGFENSLSFTFNSGTQGWTGDFADYPVTDSIFYELVFARSSLPPPLSTSTKALKISGNNHSDDLFMFIKRKVTGLTPNTTYNIKFDFELASIAPTNAIGVGGSPGESIGIKVGATKIEPKKVVQENYYRMNIDKANQSQSGNDMKLIGNVGVSDTTTVYTLIKRNNNSVPIIATTDSQGDIWLIIGTESGFEAITTLYYTKIDVTFSKM